MSQPPTTLPREAWTNAMLAEPLDDVVDPVLRQYIDRNQTLLRLLADHSAMRPNLQQTYQTPANSKNKIYFMWDFVGRTLILKGLGQDAIVIDPTDMFNDPSCPPQVRKIYQDIVSRSVLTASLLLDTNRGQLDQIVNATYPGRTKDLSTGRRPVIGDDIRAAAEALRDTPSSAPAPSAGGSAHTAAPGASDEAAKPKKKKKKPSGNKRKKPKTEAPKHDEANDGPGDVPAAEGDQHAMDLD